MFIKSLEMNNFRQFKGRQRIEFSTDKEKNVTLLLGDNTSGKTTILQAFRWCLLNKANFDKEADLLNHIVQEKMKEMGVKEEYVQVTLEIQQREMHYIITRKRTYNLLNNEVKAGKTELLVQYKTKEGNLKAVGKSEADNKLKELYPEELVDYFFYDSERVRRIAERRDITNAVRQLLGLTMLENIKRNIGTTTRQGTVLNRLRSQLSVESEEEAAEAKRKIKIAQEKLDEIAESKEHKIEEIEEYRRMIQDIENKLRTMESGMDIQHRRDQVNLELKRAHQQVEKNKENFQREFKRSPHTFFISALKSRVLDQLKEAKFEDHGIKDMNTDSIDALIERGVCVCGTEITEGSEAKKNLMKERNNLPPESISLIVQKYQNQLKHMGNIGEGFVEKLTNYYKEIERSSEEVANKEVDLEYLEESLLENKKTIELEQNNKNYRYKVELLQEDLNRLHQEEGRYQMTLEENERKYEKLTSSNDKNQEIRERMAYAEALKQRIEESYDERESNLREELEDSVNTAFQQIYHGDRKVKIDEKYNVELYTTTAAGEEIVTDRSEGLETVTNFSFVLGLIDLAQRKQEKEPELGSDAYPLVLDAPFSNTDQVHVERISKVLPSIANQLILIVMEKDWNHARDVIVPRIGCSYRLNKQSEIHTIIEEEEEV